MVKRPTPTLLNYSYDKTLLSCFINTLRYLMFGQNISPTIHAKTEALQTTKWMVTKMKVVYSYRLYYVTNTAYTDLHIIRL